MHTTSRTYTFVYEDFIIDDVFYFFPPSGVITSEKFEMSCLLSEKTIKINIYPGTPGGNVSGSISFAEVCGVVVFLRFVFF